MRSRVVGSAIALMVVTLGACGGGGGSGNGSGSSGGESARSYEGPIRSSDLELGAAAFDGACAACHTNGEPELNDLAYTPAAMRRKIREGGPRMAPIREEALDDTTMEALLAFLVTIRAVEVEAQPATASR